MCEILLKATVGLTTDDSIHFQQGDVAAVMDDGHVWGSQERLPLFWLVKVVGYPTADMIKYLSPMFNSVLPPFGPPTVIKPRLWTLDMTKVPNPMKNTLNNTGVLVVTYGNARQVTRYIKNKLTLTYDG